MAVKAFFPHLPLFLIVSLSVPAFAGQKAPKNSDVDNIGSRDINKGNILPTMSIEKEIALGRQLSAQVAQQAKFVDDPDVNEYVNRIEQNIVRNSDAKVPFTLKIIDSDEVNAFSLPGGFVFVNSGLILEADNEAELAGVLAHETAHVTARHGAEAASKQTAVGIASLPLVLLGGPAGLGIREAAEVGVPLAFLRFSRKQEAEADYLGTQYMYKTGYDPGAMISFFEKLEGKEKAKPGTVSPLFSDHPPTPDRVAAVKKEIETILPGREQYLVTTSEFDTMKARLASWEKDKPERKTQPQTRRSSRRGPTSRTQEPATAPPEPSSEDDNPPTLKRKN